MKLSSRKWRYLVGAGLVLLAASIGGCAQMGYYMQALQGQYSLLSEAKPIDEWLADPAVSTKLKDRLQKVRDIRRFAAQELRLPDNASYKNYADLKRPFVLWNVVAAEQLSVKPIQWCFPIAGCVNYRGYYSKQEAQAFARQLRDDGYDVQVYGVPAYSTLGWFNDPVLSTFIQYPDAELARLVFHELAHQIVYVKGDSRFNESFAVAVEEAGVERWMQEYGDVRMRDAYAKYDARKHDFLNLLMKYRKELEVEYASDDDKQQKLRRKAEIFQALKDEYQTLKVTWGGYAGYDRWFAEPLSNAHLAAIATYHDYVPAFRALLKQEKGFRRFYAAVKSLSELDKSDRDRSLARLGMPSAIRTASRSEDR